LLLPQQRKKPIRFVVVDGEIDLDGEIARELEEMLFVQYALPSIARYRAKRRSARNAELLRLLEQPLVEQHMAVLAILVQAKAQQRAVHHAFHPNSQRP